MERPTKAEVLNEIHLVISEVTDVAFTTPQRSEDDDLVFHYTADHYIRVKVFDEDNDPANGPEPDGLPQYFLSLETARAHPSLPQGTQNRGNAVLVQWDAEDGHGVANMAELAKLRPGDVITEITSRSDGTLVITVDRSGKAVRPPF